MGASKRTSRSKDKYEKKPTYIQTSADSPFLDKIEHWCLSCGQQVPDERHTCQPRKIVRRVA